MYINWILPEMLFNLFKVYIFQYQYSCQGELSHTHHELRKGNGNDHQYQSPEIHPGEKFSRFYVPAKMSIVPEIVHQDNLLVANSMLTSTGMIAFAVGCGLGGFLVEWFGARGGFFLDAATFFVSAMLVFSMSRRSYVKFDRHKIVESGKEILNIERSFWHEFKEGMRYLFHKKEIRFVIGILFVLLAAAGAVYVVIISFI